MLPKTFQFESHEEIRNMKKRTSIVSSNVPAIALVAVLGLSGVAPTNTGAQARLKTMPGYEQYQKMSGEIPGSVKSGALTVVWKDGGQAFEYRKDGKAYRYTIATRTKAEVEPTKENDAPQPGAAGGRRREAGGPERGRQFNSALSPNEKLKAFYRDRNLWLSDADGGNEIAITTDGNEKTRIKYATASWVYGEELGQITAIWWAPNSKKIAFYRFDESSVPDYFLQLDQTKLQSRMDVEAYPKAGAPNPVADLFIYDLHTKKTVRVDVREEWPASWTENSPAMQFLNDGKRFIWASERTGWRNFYLYDLSGKQLAT